MKWVEVVVNLPTSKLNNTYTYTVPDHLINEAVFGKRVLIDFAGHKVDAYIVAEKDLDGSSPTKTLLSVLDIEPVFDLSLLNLARWMADYYLCPLSMALSLMVPRILQHKKSQVILPAIHENEFNKLSDQGLGLNRDLFDLLWKQGELSISKALKYVTKDELAQLEANNYVTRSGVYRMGRAYKKGYYYRAGNFDYEEDLPALQRKAPRQAEIMSLLKEQPLIEQSYLDSLAAPTSMKALLKKGFIIIEHRSNSLVKSSLVLNEEQKIAVKQVEKALQTGSNSELLLFGVTGSGKTEVYLQAAESAIASGRGVIVLVPEIALTRQLVEVFASRIEETAVLHSGMSASERYDEWRRIKTGQAKLVLGARSAVFAPVPDLGLIIMDEEQEGSYKQEELPRYHTREVARMRSKMESAVMLAGSATPSIETFYAAREGDIKLLILKKRVGGGQIPKVIVEDLRKSFKNAYRSLISPILKEKIGQNLSRGEQIVLFINRRGYSPVTICGECGNIASCPSCSVSMNYHRDIEQNVCHYCNHHAKQERCCSRCGSLQMQLIGAGTQRVEEEIKQLYPEAAIARLDMDSSRRRGTQKSILDRMKSRDIDILIGTQMVAKGFDFPFVSLVGIIDADSMLYLPDFRAGERCFQLLVQAAGRAGRSSGDGEVVIQTYNPDNPVIKMAVNQDYRSFYEHEIKLRKLLNYPPFTRLLRIVFSDQDEIKVQEFALSKAQYIEDIIDASEEDIMLLGPAPCPINKISNRFRYQIIIKCSSLDLLRSIGSYIIASGTSKNVKMDIDFNPITTI